MMKKPFFARHALLVLMVVFFLAPFALRGARMAVQRMKNDVKDWLPDDFAETRELDWFRERFLGEQFVVVSWDGCTGSFDDEAYMTFIDNFFPEVPPSVKLKRLDQVTENDELTLDDVSGNWPIQVKRKNYEDPRLGLYIRQLRVGDLPPAEDRIGNRLGLHYVPNDFANWGGKDEKWIQGRGEQWYYLTPDGELYRWAGSSSVLQPLINGVKRAMTDTPVEGELVASLGPIDGPWYYENPDRLSARLFKTVTTGPGMLYELTKPGGVLDNNPEKALERLKGSLFGPDGKQTCIVVTLTETAKEDLRLAIGRGILGKPQGRLLQMAEHAGIRPPPAPSMVPPAIAWLLPEPAPDTSTLPMIRLGGPSVDNVAIDEEGQITLVRLVGLSLLVGIGLSWISFRSVNVTIMVFLVGGLSAVASLSFVYWSGKSVDAVLMSMPSLVYVLGLSGAVHIVNYYRDSIGVVGLRRAPGEAVRMGWKPCTLAAITTAIGLLSLYTSNILPIRKFGLFSAIGVMATLALLFTYLPAALQTWPPNRFRKRSPGEKLKSHTEELIEKFWRTAGGLIVNHYRLAIIGCVLLMAVTGYGLKMINTDVQLLKMFDQDAKIIRDYQWLERHLGKLVPMELVVDVDPTLLRDTASMDQATKRTEEDQRQDVLALSFLERMEIVDYIQKVLEARFGEAGSDVVGQAMSAVTFAVELPGAGSGLRSAAIRGGISRSLEDHRDEFLASDYVRIDPESHAELWRISLRLGALNDVDYGQFVEDIKQTVEPVLAAYRYREQILESIQAQRGVDGVRKAKVYLAGVPFGGASPSASQPLPQSPSEATADPSTKSAFSDTAIFCSVLTRLLRNAGVDLHDWHDLHYELPDNWAEVVAEQDCVVVVDEDGPYDVEKLASQASALVDARDHVYHPSRGTAKQRDEKISVVYTGVVPVVYKAQRTLLESLIISTVWAFVMIAIVMMFVVRSIPAGLLSMLPNVFPVVLIFGMMGWRHVVVDIGSMMTASVAMGVAVDDTIHFLTWFRRGLDGGKSRRDAILQAYERVGMAMTQTTAIGGLGLSIFAFSTFTPTQRFGTLMLALLAAALMGDLLFLPALLSSPIGRVFDGERKKKKGKDKSTDDASRPVAAARPAHKRPYPVSTQLPQNRSIRK